MNTAYKTRAFYALHALALADGIAEDEAICALYSDAHNAALARGLEGPDAIRAAHKTVSGAYALDFCATPETLLGASRGRLAQHSVWEREIGVAWERFAAVA